MPPTAAALSGIATPRMPASTSIPATGRSRATGPVANCGANSVKETAAEKHSAPSDPITNPSNYSRTSGRDARTSITGRSMRAAPPNGMASPSRSTRPTVIPAPKATK
jgi:hypothetical protein